MDDLQVEQRDQVLVVTIESADYETPVDKAEEVAREWNISSEIVAQMYAIVMYVADSEKRAQKLSWKKFVEGYGFILKLIPAEELVSRMIDDCGRNVLNPEKWFDAIKMDLESPN